MNPAQLAALQTLRGADLPITPAEREEIEAAVPAGNVGAIADVLSRGRKRLQPGVITTRGAAARFPSIDGLPGSLSMEAALLKLETFMDANLTSGNSVLKLMARAVKRQLQAFDERGLDFSDNELRNTIDALAASTAQGGFQVISTAEAAGFKALPLVDAPLSHQQVSAALEGAE